MLAALAALAGGGCESGDGGGVAVDPATDAGGGTLSWAIAERPVRLDPLFARSYPERLVARQVYEPLVAEVRAPFERSRRVPGLALEVRSSAGDRVWSLVLRRGVRFADGTPFNAQAVLANVERWRRSGAAAALLGDPLADAPRPDLVRFISDPPDPGLPERLADPRLGIVSPDAIAEGDGGPLDRERLARAGTGAFELREIGPTELLAARNTEWWGSERDLGPGVDQLRFAVIPDPDERLAALADGDVQVVSQLGAPQLRRASRDPLLVTTGTGPAALALERSVRGIPGGEPIPLLSRAWLTNVQSAR